MNFHIITIFPEMFDSYLSESILGRAIREKKIKVTFYNPRQFVSGKYKKVWPDGNVSRTVDDRPYGGGPGMVMMAEPILKAVEKIKKTIEKRKTPSSSPKGGKSRASMDVARHDFAKSKSKIKIINFVPSGQKFDTAYAKQTVSKYTDVILICGRYEGIDSRVDKILKPDRISVGDYVLTGGEIPAMIIVDCMSRQVPGVLGNFDSREEERISSSEIYTRPEILKYKNRNHKVPPVLLSGHQKNIEEWKKNQNQK